jgi:hypothetical protein
LSAISINPCFKVRPEAKGIYLERIGEDAAKKSFETVNMNDIFAIEDPHFFAPTLLLDAKESPCKIYPDRAYIIQRLTAVRRTNGQTCASQAK